MNGTTDTLTLVLTAQLPAVLVLAAVLALPVALLLLGLYRRAVVRSMRASADGSDAAAQRPAQARDAADAHADGGLRVRVTDANSVKDVDMRTPDSSVLSPARLGPWRAGAAYALAGIAFAAVMTTGQLVATGSGFLPLRFVTLLWMFAWPVVLTLNLVAVSTRRTRYGIIAGYFLGLTALGLFNVARSPDLTLGQLAFLWAWINLLPTVLLSGFMTRRVRAVGPLVLSFMVAGLAGANAAVGLAGSNDGLLRAIVEVAWRLGLDAVATFVAILLVGFAVLGVLGWWLLGRIRAAYQAKRISDQSLTLDAVWLLFGIAQSSPLAFEGPVWVLTGLVAFMVYEFVARLGLRRLAAKMVEDEGNVRLLLLRVFALGVRSQRFLDALGRHWRYAGSVQLIAGPDLATATVEPHEFLDFLGGKLARRFIGGPEALRQRLAEMDLRRDGDGRFRVNDFFCYDDTWRLVLARLIAESDVVLMDLRGFTPENAGVIYEIEQLVDVVPLGRVLMVVDATTDLPFLEETLQAAWRRARPDSPNRRSGSATVRLFRLADFEGRDLVALLRQLSEARVESRAAVPEAA